MGWARGEANAGGTLERLERLGRLVAAGVPLQKPLASLAYRDQINPAPTVCPGAGRFGRDASRYRVQSLAVRCVFHPEANDELHGGSRDRWKRVSENRLNSG